VPVPNRSLAFLVGLLIAGPTLAQTSSTSPQAQHAADCTCRVEGRSVAVGATACLRTADGPKLAECGMVLNNTSWQITRRPCPEA
jgi:hypothetical protein